MQEIPRLGVLRGRYVGKKRKKGKKAEPLTSALKKNRAAVFVHTDLTITQLHHCTLKKKGQKLDEDTSLVRLSCHGLGAATIFLHKVIQCKVPNVFLINIFCRASLGCIAR